LLEAMQTPPQEAAAVAELVQPAPEAHLIPAEMVAQEKQTISRQAQTKPTAAAEAAQVLRRKAAEALAAAPPEFRPERQQPAPTG
jgi:hypothetical protein